MAFAHICFLILKKFDRNDRYNSSFKRLTFPLKIVTDDNDDDDDDDDDDDGDDDDDALFLRYD